MDRLYKVDRAGRHSYPDPDMPAAPRAHTSTTLDDAFLRAALSPFSGGGSLKVITLGKDRTFAHLRAAPRIIRSEIVAAAKDSANWLYDSMLGYALPHIETGELAFGLFTEVVNALNKSVEIHMGGTSSHTKPVETGTGIYGPFKRPYMVRRSFRGATVSGGPILHNPDPFHRSARLRSGVYLHPGMEKRPFIVPAFRDNEARIRARMKEVGPRIKQRVERGA